MSAITDRLNAVSTAYATLINVTPVDYQQGNDGAHFGRTLNDEYARLSAAGTVASVAHNIPITAGSTLVVIPPSGDKPSTANWLAGAP